MFEALQCGIGVGSAAQKIGELFCEQHRELDLIDCLRFYNFASIGVEESDFILYALLNSPNPHRFNGNTPQGQCRG